MGSTISMVKRTYIIGRSNRNAPNLYRAYNCYDHLFPYETVQLPENVQDIRLAVALEAFNSLVSHRLRLEHRSSLRSDELELYKSIIRPEKVLYRMLSANPEARDVRLELSPDEKQVYLCRNYITELNETIGQLQGISVFQTCCNYLRYLPYGIGQLRSLKMLILSRNRLVELPDEVALCRELREIDVSFNVLRTLPRALAALKRLNTLHLAGNHFAELPCFLGKLCSLKYLNVSHNPLRWLPLEIFKLPFLLSLTADDCAFEARRCFGRVGAMTLRELAARTLVRNNLRVPRDLAVCVRDHLLRVQECAFCGGPLFEACIEVYDTHTFEGDAYPVRYRLCSMHYRSHAERLQTLFERNIPTHPARLVQDAMPSVTELFEPLCFDEQQTRWLDEGLCEAGPTMPLICLARYNTSLYRRFSMERLLEQNIENLNVFDEPGC